MLAVARRCSPLLAVPCSPLLAVARRCSPLLAVPVCVCDCPFFKFIPEAKKHTFGQKSGQGENGKNASLGCFLSKQLFSFRKCSLANHFCKKASTGIEIHAQEFVLVHFWDFLCQKMKLRCLFAFLSEDVLKLSVPGTSRILPATCRSHLAQKAPCLLCCCCNDDMQR